MDKTETRGRLLRKARDMPLSLAYTSLRRYAFGLHRSKSIGAGFDFMLHTPHQDGDDARFIDWNVYGATGEKVIKRFCEEQNLPLIIVLDLTRDMFGGADVFFEIGTTKAEAAFVVATSLHMAAKKAADPIGYCLAPAFSQNRFFPARKGDAGEEGLIACWDIVWETMSEKRRARSSRFTDALAAFSQNEMPSSAVCIISDLDETFLPDGMQAWEDAMKRIAASHAPSVIVIRTPWEETPPGTTDTSFLDAAGRRVTVRLSRKRGRRIYAEILAENKEAIHQFCRSREIPIAFAETNDGLLSAIERQFQ